MKENFVLKLYDLVGDSSAFGNDEGREVYLKLLTALDKQPSMKTVGISLSGITRTDASFPRESVVSLAKSRKGEKGLFLLDFASKDLMDNWDYAAKAKDMTMIVFSDNGYELIGKSINSGAKELLDFIIANGTATTSKVAKAFDVSAQNASAKLKKLLTTGLILSNKQAAESGGMEFVYTAIRRI